MASPLTSNSGSVIETHRASIPITGRSDLPDAGWVVRESLRRSQQLNEKLADQREQIARDLHDGIGSHLTHIISRLDMLAYNHQELEGQLLALRDFASETVAQLRETIWVLHQPELTYGQLTERMRGLITRISSDLSGPSMKVIGYGDGAVALSHQMATCLFRIMQETVNNAVKYANASEIVICLAMDATSITLLISDDGVGFDLSAVTPGYGLVNIERRTQEMNGYLQIASSEDGTDILVELPLC